MRNIKSLIPLLFILSLLSCVAVKEDKFIFFLHNKFLEDHSLEDAHPIYGPLEYYEIINAFEKEGFVVISEIRPSGTDVESYALKVMLQIDSLILTGILPFNITVIGTSKGGYIAQEISSKINNTELNFIFVGCFLDEDIEELPHINYCGNILSIYEKSDELGVSAMRRKETSKLPVSNFKEIEINTGLKHGFLFKPLKEWIEPSVRWAKQEYD